MKQILLRTLSAMRSLRSLIRYGGYVQAHHSTINYGRLFDPGTVVLVTGGSRGIGLAIARRFADNGASVAITGRNADTLQAARQAIGSDRVMTVEWDVGDTDAIPSVLDRIEKELGTVSILVNNAGIYAGSSFPHCTPLDWDKTYRVNHKGTFFLTQALCNRWIATYHPSARPRKIITISSQGGFVGANNAYRMTKWDLRGFTQYLGTSMSGHGIIANAIAPGIILTDMQSGFQAQGGNIYTSQNPSGRLGLPGEIAELAIFLASDAANFIVGQTICCDGGYTLK